MPVPLFFARLLQTALLGLFAVLFISLSVSTECYECNTLATIRDLSDPAGCGSVLELATGERLEPSGFTWLRFNKLNGQRVRIGYRPIAASSCLVGQTVEITCIVADGCPPDER
ncbi:hypothetical protein [Hymenobacter negativus]|uniref:Ig-like domain-containing protein n=1 Tax=Hymenobacter negativus TaxID=2795026 RepID=A0ABS3QA66_9BACT|nr:hypothetical protein [Hymenobacter negativus]MBO2008142.1 hypothetical protein [Hymenobacter negativus]